MHSSGIILKPLIFLIFFFTKSVFPKAFASLSSFKLLSLISCVEYMKEFKKTYMVIENSMANMNLQIEESYDRL